MNSHSPTTESKSSVSGSGRKSPTKKPDLSKIKIPPIPPTKAEGKEEQSNSVHYSPRSRLITMFQKKGGGGLSQAKSKRELTPLPYQDQTTSNDKSPMDSPRTPQRPSVEEYSFDNVISIPEEVPCSPETVSLSTLSDEPTSITKYKSVARLYSKHSKDKVSFNSPTSEVNSKKKQILPRRRPRTDSRRPRETIPESPMNAQKSRSSIMEDVAIFRSTSSPLLLVNENENALAIHTSSSLPPEQLQSFSPETSVNVPFYELHSSALGSSDFEAKKKGIPIEKRRTSAEKKKKAKPPTDEETEIKSAKHKNTNKTRNHGSQMRNKKRPRTDRRPKPKVDFTGSDSSQHKLTRSTSLPVKPYPQPDPRWRSPSKKSFNQKVDMKKKNKKKKVDEVPESLPLTKKPKRNLKRTTSEPYRLDNCDWVAAYLALLDLKTEEERIKNKAFSSPELTPRVAWSSDELEDKPKVLQRDSKEKRGDDKRRLEDPADSESRRASLRASRSLSAGSVAVSIRSSRRLAKSISPKRHGSFDSLQPIEDDNFEDTTRVLDIRIIKARLVHKSLPNPYCLVKVGDASFKTQRLQKSSEPHWNTDCSFIYFPKAATIYFTVYNKVKGVHHVLGEAKLTIPDVVNMSREKEHRLSLKDGPNSIGKLYIQIQLNGYEDGMLAHYGFPVSQSFPLRVKAGDIVLFSHNRVHGVIIKVATSSRWNHIGVVMPGHLKPNNLRVLHATTAGVTIHSLAGTLNAWAKNKRVCMAFRRVLDAPTEDLKEIESILTNFYMSIEGRPYGNLGVMMKAVLHTNQESDLSTLFCSELVAACFKELGLLAKDTVSSNYVPGDFAKANFKLLKGSLSPVIKVHRPSDRR